MVVDEKLLKLLQKILPQVIDVPEIGPAMILVLNGDQAIVSFCSFLFALLVVFSPNGERLATAGDDNAVRIWDALNGHDLLTLRGDALPPMRLGLQPQWQAPGHC